MRVVSGGNIGRGQDGLCVIRVVWYAVYNSSKVVLNEVSGTSYKYHVLRRDIACHPRVC